MAEIRLRLNLDAEDVELVVDGKVVTSTGPEVFRNWVAAYNEKHKPALDPEVVHEEHDKVVDVDEPVEEKHVPVEEEVVETSTEEVVDTPEKE